jgi:hypothetical protein
MLNKDSFKDAHLSPPYRTEKPAIVHMGPEGAKPAGEKSNKFVSIEFNSTQSSLLRMSNGEFLFLGQD